MFLFSLFGCGDLSFFGFQYDSAQRRQREFKTIRQSVRLALGSLNFTAVDHSAAAEFCVITVNKLTVYTRFRNTEHIIVSHNGREINRNNKLRAVFIYTSVGIDASVSIVSIYPFESVLL